MRRLLYLLHALILDREAAFRLRPIHALVDLRALRHRLAERLFSRQEALPRLAGWQVVGVPTAVHERARVFDVPVADVVLEFLRGLKDGQEGGGLVPAALDVGDGDADLALRELPRRGLLFQRLDDAVVEVDLLAHADGELLGGGWGVGGVVGHDGEAVEVADEVDGCGGGAGAVGLEALDDAVHDHDVLAIGCAQADGLADPEFLAAIVDAVVEALAGCDEGVAVAEALEKDEAFIDGFGGEDASVYFGVSVAEAAFDYAFPVDVAEVHTRLVEARVVSRWGAPGKPGA